MSRLTTLVTLGVLACLGACSVGQPSAAPPTDRPSPSATSSARPTAERSPTTAAPRPSPSRRSTRSAPPRRTGWGPNRAEVARARTLVSRLDLAELAGQVIVARYAGTGAPVDLVRRLHLGGVIVFDDNIASTASLRRSNRRLQQAVDRAWPVFVGVDQEGGVVERVKGSATRFPSFMSLGAAGNPRLTRAAAAASGGELAGLGFTVVFAPVADVTTGPEDPTIGSRSAADAPRRVARHVVAATEGYRAAGVVPVVKHFPGHGSVTTDSHVELPVQRKHLDALLSTDLVPFERAVAEGVPAVMVAHIDVRTVDPGTPASLSRAVVTGLLRERLGFAGLVVTDALDMAAVAERFGSGRASVRALRAGADVLLMPPDPTAARDAIVSAVRAGRLSRARLEDAAARQVALLLHQQAGETALRPPGSGGPVSRRVSASAVTVVSGACSGRLVGRSVQVTGPAEDVARFRAAADRAGLATGSGTTVALVGYGGAPQTADVVVSTDTPYVLAESTARRAKIALYGDTPGAMRALVDVLLGRKRAPGRLPVDVPGLERRGC